MRKTTVIKKGHGAAGRWIWDMVIKDMKERREFGAAKHGQHLRAGDGARAESRGRTAKAIMELMGKVGVLGYPEVARRSGINIRTLRRIIAGADAKVSTVEAIGKGLGAETVISFRLKAHPPVPMEDPHVSEEEFGRYFSQEADEDAEAAIEQHIEGCECCATEYGRIRAEVKDLRRLRNCQWPKIA